MVIIPAIDLKGGKCVRLLQGEEGTETVFHNDPVAVARLWEEKGAKRLHIIDLDGAFLKRPYHVDLITEMVKAVSIPVQVGGGIRTAADIECYLKAGVQWVILGTLALEAKKEFSALCRKFPGHILLAIDAKDGKVATQGWKKITDKDAFTLAQEAETLGVAGINYTDITRDGMETGPNIGALNLMLDKVALPVYVAGGVAALEDIKRLLPFKEKGLAGVIIGRALYTGKIDLKEAMAIVGGN